MKKGFAQVIVLILVVSAVVVVGYFFFRQKPVEITNTPATPVQETQKDKLKTFKSSSIMNFSIEVPEEYGVEERFGTVTITSKNGEIEISMNGTNFDNLRDYIKYHGNNLEDRITSRNSFKIDELEVLSGFIKEKKYYFIYIDNQVYSIFTKTEPLYPVLDQIAKSFRYTGKPLQEF